MELHQKVFGERRSFFLLPNRIKVCLKNIRGEHESYFSYESLEREAQIIYHKSYRLLFAAIVSIAFLVCLLLPSLAIRGQVYYTVYPLIVAILSIILYLYKRRNYVIIETKDCQKIIFIQNKSNRKALETFLIQLWLYRKQYLRDKYFYIDYSCDPDRQTLRLRWLLEQNIITRAEYELAREDWVIDRSYRH